MSRNGSGTYSLPSNSLNPIVSGTTIDSSDTTETLGDIADALTASIAKDGQTTTTARVPFAAGVSSFAGATTGVSYSFSSDPNTGLYSNTADKCGIVAGGTEIARFESGLISPVANNTIDLGSSGVKFKDAYLAGTLTLATLTFSGTDPYPKKATTNTFTRGQTITGGSDEIQLKITANATQTARTFVVEQSGGGDIFDVDAFGGSVNVTGALNVDGYQDGNQLYVKASSDQAAAVMLVEKDDGTDLFKLDKDGNVTIAGTVNIGAMPSGTLLQSVSGTYATNEALATTIPLDDTIPQNTEGTEVLTLAITPKNTSNILELEFTGFVSGAATTTCIAALFQDTTADALAVGVATAGSATDPNAIRVVHRMTAGTTSATTFKIRVGGETGTIRMNGSTSARYFGGIANARLTIREYKA